MDLWRLGSPKICSLQTGEARELMVWVQPGELSSKQSMTAAGELAASCSVFVFYSSQ